ncbi:MAG TPA: ferredoxin reductase family protein [Actinomycetota bacterium]|nr:ferredoxin reductase family protein [Actinomycetota bacterium]
MKDRSFHRLRTLQGPVALSILFLVTIALWLEAAPPGGWFGGASRSLSALGLAVGLVGYTSFAANLLLGARLPSLDRFFGGLESMYRVHRINGRFAYAALALHVALILCSRAVDDVGAALALLSPAAGATVLAGVAAFVAMSVAIALTLRARLTNETFIYVQRSFGLIFMAGALHAFLTPGAKASSSALTAYLAGLSILALAAFTYRSLFGNLLVRRYDYVVSSVVELDPAVVEISLAPTDRALTARAGQFVFVTFYSDRFNAQFHPMTVMPEGDTAVIVLRPGDARHQFHPFSLTSPVGARELRLVVKAVGDFTSALHELEPGAVARVEGPYGDFSYRNVPGRRQIWVAGGIGITPFLSMARSLRADDGYRVDLLWGVNDRTQAFFADELRSIEAGLEGFGFVLVPEDERGFIDARMLLSAASGDVAEFLIVGPPPMERALRAQLLEAGVAEGRIHSERFAFGPPRA